VAVLSGCIPEPDSQYDDLSTTFGVSEKDVEVKKYYIDGPMMGDSAQYWEFACNDPNAPTTIIDTAQLSPVKNEIVAFQFNENNPGEKEVVNTIPVKATSSLHVPSLPKWWPYASQSSYSIYKGKRDVYEGYELWIPEDVNEAHYLYRGVY
jgi:hypothetical protein